MIAMHHNNEADMTIACLEVPLEEAAGAFGVMTIDEAGRIIEFNEKPENPAPMPGRPGFCLASMGNYLFNTDFLYEQLIKDADNSASSHDFGKDIIPSIIGKYRVYAYPFRDKESGEPIYWRDVGTLDAFWEANMELVNVTPELNLYDQDWPILTHQVQLPPAKFVFDRDDRRGMATDSMVSGGCVISGSRVTSSLLFSNVRVHSYGEISNSVILPDVEIGRNVRLNKTIIDRGCTIKPGMVIGEDNEQDRANGFRVTGKGVVLVTPDMLGQSTHEHR